MLISILKEIARSSTHSYSSLAKSLEVDYEMIKHMLQDLLRMGYIVTDDPGCGDDACDSCSVCCNKSKVEKALKSKLGTARWKLTEKGKEAAARE